jgi:hypothetical protein
MGVNGVTNASAALSPGNNPPCPVCTDHIWAESFISKGTARYLGNVDLHK